MIDGEMENCPGLCIFVGVWEPFLQYAKKQSLFFRPLKLRAQLDDFPESWGLASRKSFL